MIPFSVTTNFSFAFALSFLTCLSQDLFARDGQTRNLLFGGVERHYIISAPTPGGPRPTIFVLHGGGGSANNAIRGIAMEPLVERENLVAIYPNAFRREWNDGRDGRQQTRSNTDDVTFIRTLVRSLVDEGVADAKRIYVTGPSNGGMMTLRLLCEAPELFAAAAPIIANFPVDAASKCKPSRPLPVLVINGTADPLVPYAGGGVGFAGRRGNVISTDDDAAAPDQWLFGRKQD